MILPLLYGPQDSGRGQAPDQALESDRPPHQADREELLAGRFEVPVAAKTGGLTLGL